LSRLARVSALEAAGGKAGGLVTLRDWSGDPTAMPANGYCLPSETTANALARLRRRPDSAVLRMRLKLDHGDADSREGVTFDLPDNGRGDAGLSPSKHTSACVPPRAGSKYRPQPPMLGEAARTAATRPFHDRAAHSMPAERVAQ
jgi:hypothetical protein